MPKDQIVTFFKDAIFSRINEHEADWVTSRIKSLTEDAKPKDLFLAFSAVPRFVEKRKLNWNPKELKEANTLRSGFNPEPWTLDQLVRTYLLLKFDVDEKLYHSSVEQIFDTADMRELATLYKSLPVLPYQKRFLKRSEEGVRTNMTNVFDAIVLENPYPFDHLSENAWNQMVLKAAFMDRPIYRIYGIDERSNAELSRIISDYAHERWAAGRSVSPELWRPVGRFINDALIDDAERLFQSDSVKEKQAAALLCLNSENEVLQDKLNERKDLKQQVENREITWDNLGASIWEQQEESESY